MACLVCIIVGDRYRYRGAGPMSPIMGYLTQCLGKQRSGGLEDLETVAGVVPNRKVVGDV